MNTGDSVMKKLEGRPRPLQKNKCFTEEKKRKIESKQSCDGQQGKRMSWIFVVVLLQNDIFCFNCATSIKTILKTDLCMSSGTPMKAKWMATLSRIIAT